MYLNIRVRRLVNNDLNKFIKQKMMKRMVYKHDLHFDRNEILIIQ